LSDREFAPQISNIEFNYAANRETMVYALALRKDVKNPFPPESDEVTIAPAPTPQPDRLNPPTNQPPVDEKQPQPMASVTPSPAPTATPSADAPKQNAPNVKTGND
jgi:tricorn protease